MSADKTEEFLRDWAATVPLPQGPGEGTYVSYTELQEVVQSYVKCIREENDELPMELRLSGEMQLYQARQTAVLEYWGSPGHRAFPQAPDLAAYIDNTWRRLEFVGGREGRTNTGDVTLGEPLQVSISPAASDKETTLSNLAVPVTLSTTETTAPTAASPRVVFRLPASAKTGPYRKKDRSLPESDENQDSPKSPSQKTADVHELSTTVSEPNFLGDLKVGFPKTIAAAVKYKEPVAPIWPGMRIQGRWDPHTGFPAGAFVFSSDRAFRRIVGQFIENGVGQILGTVNVDFPLLNLRWARTAMRENGRRDLAVWVELSPAGISRMDSKSLVEKEIVLRGLREFYQRDLAGADEYLDVFFRQNIEQFRSET